MTFIFWISSTGNTLNRQTLHDALRATAHKRGTEQHFAEAAEVFEEVENSPVMQKLWESYRKKFFLCGRSGVEHHHGGGSQFICAQ